MIGCLQEGKGGVYLSVFVQPRASRNEVVGLQGEEMKVRLTSPPVEGAANRMVINFLADLLDLPVRDVILTSGFKSRHKRLFLQGTSLPAIESLLIKTLS